MANIKEFETYLNEIMKSVQLNQVEIADLKEEWNQHLVELMNDFVQKGFSKSEAVELAIKQFGDAQHISSQMEKSYFPFWKIHFLKEILVWMICLVAASVGPILLINAQYQMLFIIGPLILLTICYGMYHGLIRRASSPELWYIMLPILYGGFVLLFLKNISIEYFMSQLVTLELNGNGIFTISVIHFMWIGIMIRALASHTSIRNRWIEIVRSSFEYWAMLMISFVIMNSEILTSTGEGKVIIVNVFLLYVFLQKIIEPASLIKSKNQVKYWLT